MDWELQPTFCDRQTEPLAWQGMKKMEKGRYIIIYSVCIENLTDSKNALFFFFLHTVEWAARKKKATGKKELDER